MQCGIACLQMVCEYLVWKYLKKTKEDVLRSKICVVCLAESKYKM